MPIKFSLFPYCFDTVVFVETVKPGFLCQSHVGIFNIPKGKAVGSLFNFQKNVLKPNGSVPCLAVDWGMNWILSFRFCESDCANWKKGLNSLEIQSQFLRLFHYLGELNYSSRNLDWSWMPVLVGCRPLTERRTRRGRGLYKIGTFPMCLAIAEKIPQKKKQSEEQLLVLRK